MFLNYDFKIYLDIILIQFKLKMLQLLYQFILMIFLMVIILLMKVLMYYYLFFFQNYFFFVTNSMYNYVILIF